MRKTLHKVVRYSQRGVAAVEMALMLPLLVVFIVAPSLFWALYFYEYSVAQKAVHDATLYLSTAPKLEMTTAGPDGSPVALTIAKNIISKEMAGLNPSEPSIVCGYKQSTGILMPKLCSMSDNQDYKQVLVQFYVSINISYLDPLTGYDSGMRISPYAYVAYTGN